MSTEKLILSPIPVEELEERFEQIIVKVIKNREITDLKEKFFSPEETRNFFNPPISKVTLHHWAQQGRIKQHKIGGRVFYRYSDIMESLVHLKKYGR
jgi:hypothetical protein